MSLLLYNIFLFLYTAAIKIYSLFDSKARKWITGRREQRIEKLPEAEKRIWIHCSSLGEFEQGRPLVEGIKEQYPQYKIVLTFFSPSGYEVRKNYDKADYVFYLPMDGKKNAREFINAVTPVLAIFVKYDFWHYYLHQLRRKKIPVILVSAAFRQEQVFFKRYGGFFRRMLECFTQIFVQDEQSKELLHSIGIDQNVIMAGDTRYDRVAAIMANIKPVDAVEKFRGGNKILIAGSTWPGDESILQSCLSVLPANWKLVIAPHEVDESHIQQIQKLFGNDTVLFSGLTGNNEGYSKRVLIINNIGLLSSLYAYGDVAYIGGGFQKGGIHNVLEPAVFGLPVIFGPVYDKFVEAKQLVAVGCAFPVKNREECSAIIQKLAGDENYRLALKDSLKRFVQKKTGATTIILRYINELAGRY